MARKPKHEEHENHERWLVSYADFITLLFAFFVVMYSVSSVNEGKYRVLSDSLVAAFRSPTKSIMPTRSATSPKARPARQWSCRRWRRTAPSSRPGARRAAARPPPAARWQPSRSCSNWPTTWRAPSSP
jgi:flagellar motor protein MotB